MSHDADLRIDVKSKYVDFLLTKILPKTVTYDVVNKNDGTLLGEIRWWAPWRQYCYFTQPEIVLAPSCMSDITEFCKKLNEARKEMKK